MKDVVNSTKKLYCCAPSNHTVCSSLNFEVSASSDVLSNILDIKYGVLLHGVTAYQFLFYFTTIQVELRIS